MNLQNHFLIAMPALMDFNFTQALIYVCAHNEEGAMGIIINRPIIEISLREVLEQMKISSESEGINNLPIYLGGPIQPERGFIIHRPNHPWQSTLVTSGELAVTSSQDILQAIAKGQGPDDSIIILGYSGWGAGQLEQEIADNFWLTASADPKILFDTPADRRWQAAMTSLGIDTSSLSSEAGHA